MANRAESFVLESIESRIMSDDSKGKKITQYWSTLKLKLEKAKEILPSTFRIGETIFTSMAVIGGRLYRNHPENLNHMHKDVKDLVSVIITLGKDISGGDNVFYDGVKSCNFGNRAHILKNSHGRIVFVPFEKVFHEGTLWSGYRFAISFILTKKISFISILMQISFMTDI